ncbi:MAG: hypothetical protein Q9227_007241 [Pyrenula ochraceoflavens]
MASSLPNSPVFQALSRHDPQKTAIVHSDSGRTFTYGSLLHDVSAAKAKLLETANGKSLAGERVAFLAENSYDYVVTFLSILAHEAIALPLSQGFPASELRYIIENSEAAIFLSTNKFRSKADEVVKEEIKHKPILATVEKIEAGAKPDQEVKLDLDHTGKGGFMLYTSGTTSRPKGVLLSDSVITAQARSLIEAWEYTSQDYLLHVLPLHHIHGTINALVTPLFAGSTIEFLYPFNANSVWERLAAPFLPSPTKKSITFFTVVPTIYNRLLSSHSTLSPETQTASRTAISPNNMRLNISGSAALPTPTKAAWTELSHGNVLLERFGMTEVGMALSCGLAFDDRIDGSVGWPLPSVEARLVDTETGEVVPVGQEVDKDGKEREGEIQLLGPTVFTEYWRNPEATASEFVQDSDGRKWFKTGDVATRRIVEGAGQNAKQASWAKGPMYFIRGRKSVDIIKTGGEKVSALEVERELLSLPEITEAAVLGVPNEQWGQKVAAVVVIKEGAKGAKGKDWGVMDMRRALRERLVNYKVPQELKVVEEIPKNTMGKSELNFLFSSTTVFSLMLSAQFVPAGTCYTAVQFGHLANRRFLVNKKSLLKEVFPDGA